MNTVTETLSMALYTVMDALGAGLGVLARAMLANVQGAEWASALVLAIGVWLLLNRRKSAGLGFALFLLGVSAGAWLSWKTGHTGVTAQQAALAVMVLHGQLRARGWALVRGYSKA